MDRWSIEGLELGSGAPAVIVAEVSRHARGDPDALAEGIRRAALAGADAVRVGARPGWPRETLASLLRVARESQTALILTCASAADVEHATLLGVPALALEPDGLGDRTVLAAAAAVSIPVLVICDAAPGALVARARASLGPRAIPVPGHALDFDFADPSVFHTLVLAIREAERSPPRAPGDAIRYR